MRSAPLGPSDSPVTVTSHDLIDGGRCQSDDTSKRGRPGLLVVLHELAEQSVTLDEQHHSTAIELVDLPGDPTQIVDTVRGHERSQILIVASRS